LAIKPRDNEAFYREVDEELRKERLSSIWKRYGILLILVVLLVLAAIAGTIWWKNHREAQRSEQSQTLLDAFGDLQANRMQEAQPRLDGLIEDGAPGHRAAALLTKAAIALQENKDAEAIQIFARVAGDGDLPEPYRELALIRQTAVEYDRLEPGVVIERLQPLAQPGNPWFGTAGEMVAVAHLKANRPQQAGPIFAAIAKDPQVPDTIRSRAVQMAGALGIDATQHASAPAGEGQGATKEANE
jgi:hypothetical protein